MTTLAESAPRPDGGTADLARLLAELPAKVAEAARLPALIAQEDVPGYVGVSRPVMFRLIAAGKFPKAVDAGGGRKFRRADLDKWVAALKPAR